MEDKSDIFIAYWAMLAPSEMRDIWMREYRFNRERRWRFDYAHPPTLCAVEVDGGQFVARGGRHATDADRDKLNHAAAAGWVVFRFSPQQLETDPSGCVALVLRRIVGQGAT